MQNELIVDGNTYHLSEAELLLPLDGESRWMYLTVGCEQSRVGFGMWDVEFALLKNLDELHGKRMHVGPDYSTYDDDTLGTDITQMYETTDINYLSTDEQTFSFGEIQLDFERIEGLKYRCRLKATLTDDMNAELPELPPSAFKHTATAEFFVTIEARRPGE